MTAIFNAPNFEDMSELQATAVPDQAIYSSALSIVFLIDQIKKGLIRARILKDYETRYDLLVSFYIALSGVMEDKESWNELKKVHEGDYWPKCKNALQLIRDAKIKKQLGLIKLNEIEIFDIWELRLNETQQKLGLGMPKKNDARYAMSR